MTGGGAGPHARLHHLDALRAGAMLLGVVLHAAISFTDMDWPVKDVHAGAGATGLGIAAIHGFRMQLFFLLSGYFSMGLLRHRGTRAYLANRGRRIALPFAASCATVVPATWAVMWIVSDGRAPRAVAELVSGLPWLPWLLVFPILGHLWFLWFLCWMTPALPLLARAVRAAPRLRPPRILVATPLCMLWLVPLTAVLTAPMSSWGTKPGFTADTFAGILPMPHLLAYYGAFFGFGAIVAAVPGAMHGIARGWWALLAAAAIVALPAIVLGGLAPEATRMFPDPGVRRIATLLLSAAYPWLMCLGLIGAAGRFLHAERPAVRWLADSSYWVYLVHLPVVLLLQRAVAQANIGAATKFTFIMGASMAALLLAYGQVVRRTWVGRMLNGPRP